MPSDSNRNSHNGSNIPGWVWLFTGTVLGAFIMFLVHLSDAQDKPRTNAKNTNTLDDNESIQFDFYEILKNAKVDVGHSSNTTSSSAKNKPDEKMEYLLQVASFKSIKDAEQLRAELILLNLPATTEMANIRNGETWHRVIVGPYTSHSKLASARSTLVSNRYEALMLKRVPQG